MMTNVNSTMHYMDMNSSVILTSTMTSPLNTETTNASINDVTCTPEPSSLADDILFINRAFTPFIYVIGFPGNILSFIIWIRPRMRHSSGVYVAALALVDFIFLLLHVPYELNAVWDVQTLNYPVICESFPVIYMTFQYLSPLLVLAFTIERYISICHPFKRERFCTTRRAKIVSISLAMVSLAICAIQGYFWSFGEEGCEIRVGLLEGDNTSFWNLWSWVTEMMIFLVVPLCNLIVNILVIRELKRISRYESNQLHGRSQKTSTTTVMLLAVSFYLIFTTLPVTVTYVAVLNFPYGTKCSSHETDDTWRAYYRYDLVRTVCYEIGITHFALNFYIYMITGKMFRKEFKKICLSIIGKSLPEKVRTEYTNFRSSFGGSVKKTMTVHLTSNGATTTTENGNETTF